MTGSGESCGNLEQERVRVAEHGLAPERRETVERLRGFGAALHDVAEADDVVDTDALDVLEHGAEGDVVRVLVRDEREAHAARLPWRAGRGVAAQAPHVVAFAAVVAAAVASAATGRSSPRTPSRRRSSCRV